MSGDISDTYAVVDKSKKTNNTMKASHQPPFSPDPVADLYSVVDKSNKSKPYPTTLTEDTYEALPPENLYYNTVAAATDESAALYDSASAPTYSKLDHTQVNSAVVKNYFPMKQTPVKADPSPGEEHKIEQNRKQKKSRQLVCLLACFTVLIIALIAAAIAVAMAFVLIAGLRSDLTAALKDSSSSSGSTTENKNATNSLEPQINELRIGFDNYTATVTHQLHFLNQNTSGGVEDLNQQINSTFELLREMNDKINFLTSSTNALERNISEQLSEISNNTITKLQSLNSEIREEIMNASNISITAINTLTDGLASGIQDLHTFDSCATVSAFPIQLPSGMYNISSSDSIASKEYCSTSIAFLCNGVPRRWRRIAFLNTINEPGCPDTFEVRVPNSNPRLCRRTATTQGCNSVMYHSNDMSYSQVCGTVRVHPEGSPDGFDTFNDDSIYVDGVYFTYGDSSNRNHIWTYTAATTVGSSTRGCDQCNHEKPSNIPGTNFTCTSAHCSDADNCFPNTLWGNEAQQCFGNETFYRQLSESTTDDIEMRVCRDQRRSDEDILISFVELYVS